MGYVNLDADLKLAFDALEETMSMLAEKMPKAMITHALLRHANANMAQYYLDEQWYVIMNELRTLVESYNRAKDVYEHLIIDVVYSAE